jgi:hypothetical protein
MTQLSRRQAVKSTSITEVKGRSISKTAVSQLLFQKDSFLVVKVAAHSSSPSRNMIRASSQTC